MFERLSAPILACCNSLLSAVFCAWLPFRAHCLAHCLRHSAKCAKDMKLSSFCEPEGHRFKWTWNLWQSNPISKKGVPKYRLLCHFAFNPRLPPPCAVRCPREVLYFARMVSWAAFHWDRYLQDFVGSLRHCTANSWYIETLNSSRATTRSTLRLQSLGSLALPDVFPVVFVKYYDSMQLRPITVATCQRMRSRWFPRLPLPGVDVVSTFDIAFGEPGWAAAAKACLSSDSVWYEQKSPGSLIKTTTSVCIFFPSCQGLRYFNLSLI